MALEGFLTLLDLFPNTIVSVTLDPLSRDVVDLVFDNCDSNHMHVAIKIILERFNTIPRIIEGATPVDVAVDDNINNTIVQSRSSFNLLPIFEARIVDSIYSIVFVAIRPTAHGSIAIQITRSRPLDTITIDHILSMCVFVSDDYIIVN